MMYAPIFKSLRNGIFILTVSHVSPDHLTGTSSVRKSNLSLQPLDAGADGWPGQDHDANTIFWGRPTAFSSIGMTMFHRPGTCPYVNALCSYGLRVSLRFARKA